MRLIGLVLAVSLAFQWPAHAQFASISFAGEWRIVGGPTVSGDNWAIVIEQKGIDLRGSWKQSYRDRHINCSGIWFEGQITGNRIVGTRYPCAGNAQPLSMAIVDANTLEVSVFAGGTGTTSRLLRIK